MAVMTICVVMTRDVVMTIELETDSVSRPLAETARDRMCTGWNMAVGNTVRKEAKVILQMFVLF